jgi:RNA polymerase-binding transcription factor DksA
MRAFTQAARQKMDRRSPVELRVQKTCYGPSVGRWSHERRILLKLRNALFQRLYRLAADGENENAFIDPPADCDDRAPELDTATFDYELLDEVLSALQRLKDGTYGICERTGREIPAEKLREVPWTRCSDEV